MTKRNAIRTKIALSAAALFILATPALADMSVPPLKYDLGNDQITEWELRDIVVEAFGTEAPKIIRVPVGQAYAQCNSIYQARWHVDYPVDDKDKILGCYIKGNCEGWPGPCNPDPTIVYSYNNDYPWLAVQLLRHELGHYLGWGPYHER